MTKSPIERYVEIRQAIGALESELEGLKPAVFDYVMEQEGEKVETPEWVLSIRQGRKKWTYSDSLMTKEKQIKQAIKEKKIKEQKDGTAVLEVAPAQLVFNKKQGEGQE